MNEGSWGRLSVDLVRLAIVNLLRRPARSLLTMVGIAIGMTAVVGLLGLTGGVQRVLERQFERIGHDLVLILPGTTRSLPASQTVQIDLQKLRSLPGVARAGAFLTQTLPVTTQKAQGFLTVMGLSPETWGLADRFFARFTLAEGKLPVDEGNEALLTEGAARDLDLAVGDVFRIVDQEFHVRGVLQSTGDVRTEGAILVSLETLWHLSGKTDAVSLAWVKAQAQQDVEALAVDLEQTPAVISGSYTVQTSKRLSEIVQTVMRLLKATLLGIAAVALLVGGIGLMNTMFMAVLERTREIGILASLGAHSRQILALILWESGLLGLLGGMIGVLLGVGLSMSVAAVIAQAVGVPPFAPVVRVCLVVGSLLFSLGLGMVAGILPARRAARLRPVEALRHE